MEIKQNRLNPIILNLPAAGVNRLSHFRDDPAKLEEIAQKAYFILRVEQKWILSQIQLPTLLRLTQKQIEIFSLPEYANFITTIFLGEFENELYFSLNINDGQVANFILGNLNIKNENLKTLREISMDLSLLDYNLAIHANSISNWHESHTHCPKCGRVTQVSAGGSMRICLFDNSEHFPRTDPAIITLIRDEADRILLGRQFVWEKNRFSTFAGFVEGGESFEEAVIREVREEAGIDVEQITYLGSQPWPFPASIMIAYCAVTKNPAQAKPDLVEIEEIRWYSRSDMKTDLENGNLTLPHRASISRKMIEAWYGQPL